MKQSVFISRDEKDVQSLKNKLEEIGFSVNAFPLIRLEAVPFNADLPETDWIFFSSANAVRFFFNQKPTIKNQKFGAIGEATAESMKIFCNVDYIGDSSDIEQSARNFQKQNPDKTVLFPGSEQSMRHVQSVFDPQYVHDLVCYRTIFASNSAGQPDILIFSSPSNVDSFFLSNTFHPFQKVIAYGAATALALKKHGVEIIAIPISLNDEGLMQAIKSVCNS